MGDAVFLAVAAHGIDLVFQQGDEGRDDNGDAVHEARRELVTQGFAAACRHEHKCVTLGEQVLDDCFLIAFERFKTEVFLQCRCQLAVLRHNSRFRVLMISQIYTDFMNCTIILKKKNFWKS